MVHTRKGGSWSYCRASAAAIASTWLLAALVGALPSQHVLSQTQGDAYRSSGVQNGISAIRVLDEGVGHFSQWSKAVKREFIDDVAAGRANEWTVVMGNEGGDLDSMTAALTWSYHISHKALANHTSEAGGSSLDMPDWDKSPTPAAKVIALLQTPKDALDLRPENRLALHNVQMAPGHRDLLTLDELPMPPAELASKIRGIVLVDHPEPLSVWKQAKVLSLFDHHKDRGAAPDAHPRIFEGTASCTTIVARQMLDELEALDREYHMPHEVVELILDAIALDSDGLKKATPEDVFTSRRLLKRSNWRREKLLNVMRRLDADMSSAKKNLDNLDVRDLLRRDWKGDVVETSSEKYANVHVGFASIPIALDEQIKRTLHERVQSWFEIAERWTVEIGADVSLSLHSYKVKKSKRSVNETVPYEDEDDEEDADEHEDQGGPGSDQQARTAFRKTKVREICLMVRAGVALDENAADSLFAAISDTIGDSPFLDTEPWDKVDQLQNRQMVWVHHQPNGGRKLIRPIVEEAVRAWTDDHLRNTHDF